MSRFFELWDDKEIPGRWYLKAPMQNGQWINPNRFTGGQGRVDIGNGLTMSLRRPGQSLDYTMAESGLPIISERAVAQFLRHAGDDVQLIPISIEGQSAPFFILNALHALDCVDEQRSEGIQRWTAADNRPEGFGGYGAIDVLRIDTGRVGDHSLLRVKGWEVALVISESLRDALVSAHLIGPTFDPV